VLTFCCPPKFNIAIAETKRLIAESTARATAMHDMFAGRERFLHEEKIYTRTLGSAGDLTIYAVRHGTLFCARHLGAGDNLRTTLAAASIRPTF
jgi:hypothetical protein